MPKLGLGHWLFQPEFYTNRGRFGFDAGDKVRGACGDGSESPKSKAAHE